MHPQHYSLEQPVRAIVAPIIDDTASKRMQDSLEKHLGHLSLIHI